MKNTHSRLWAVRLVASMRAPNARPRRHRGISAPSFAAEALAVCVRRSHGASVVLRLRPARDRGARCRRRRPVAPSKVRCLSRRGAGARDGVERGEGGAGDARLGRPPRLLLHRRLGQRRLLRGGDRELRVLVSRAVHALRHDVVDETDRLKGREFVECRRGDRGGGGRHGIDRTGPGDRWARGREGAAGARGPIRWMVARRRDLRPTRSRASTGVRRANSRTRSSRSSFSRARRRPTD